MKTPADRGGGIDIDGGGVAAKDDAVRDWTELEAVESGDRDGAETGAEAEVQAVTIPIATALTSQAIRVRNPMGAA